MNVTAIIILLVATLGFAAWFIMKFHKEISTVSQELDSIDSDIVQLQNLVKEKTDGVDTKRRALSKQESEINTSVKYAEQIQRSMIPTPQMLKKLFPESFVYFSPKAVVSGDFYYMSQLKCYTVMVVADCTGHGVPGGFLSMLGMSGLKELLPKYYDSAELPTAEILNKLRTFVISSLALAIEDEGADGMAVQDGMDMTMAAFSADRRMLRYSLADHNIYVCRDGNLDRLKGDKMPIGRHPNQDDPFQQLEMALVPGDMVYLCSDGVQDQIGGPENTKFKTKRLGQMVQNASAYDIDTQYNMIAKEIDDWKEGFEQVDDQTLIGIRIL